MADLRRLAHAAAAAVAPAAISVVSAVLAELPAAERAGSKIRDLRAQLRGVAALLTPAVFVTGLAELAALVPAPVLAPIVLTVPVGLVSACGVGVLLAEANRAEEAQRGGSRATYGETETASGPRVELGIVQLCPSLCARDGLARLSEYVKSSASGTVLSLGRWRRASKRRGILGLAARLSHDGTQGSPNSGHCVQQCAQ